VYLTRSVHPGAHCPCDGGIVWKMSRRFAMVGFQQSAPTLDANDLALIPFMLRLDDLVETLVNPLVMIVLEILR
jgi:hypothetical protein